MYDLDISFIIVTICIKNLFVIYLKSILLTSKYKHV